MDGAPQSERMRQFLRDHDVPCPGCGYNLRGLTGLGCPECDQELELRVNLAEPSLGPLIALLVPPIAAASCGAAMLVIVVVMSLYHGDWVPAEVAMQFVVAPLGFAASGTALAWRWGREAGRRRFRGLGQGGRRQRVLAVWIGGLVLFALYVGWLTQLD
jgi:hypothetical protein